MRRLPWWLSSLCLTGCAFNAPDQLPAPVFSSAVHFAAPAAGVIDVDPFALDQAMQRFLDGSVKPNLRDRTPQQALLEALASRTGLKIDYDAAFTRTAAQTFGAHAGNCLSLVIMTSALARALNLGVTYNQVAVDEVWSRRAGLQSAIGHVNLTLGKRLSELRNFNDARGFTTVDFLPPQDLAHQRSREISEGTVLSMYFNNRAVELLAEGRPDDAYWAARTAILRDPQFASARNTLGVVYLRHGDLAAAYDVFAQRLQQDPHDTTALVNQIQVLTRLGQPAAAAALAQTLHRLQPVQPFQLLDDGIAALRRNEPDRARHLLEQARERDGDQAEILYWLAIAQARGGDAVRAGVLLREAIGNSTAGEQRATYVAKLKRLKSGVAD